MPPVVIETKRCTRCRRRKALSSFGKASNCKDGLNPQCKLCKREARKLSAAIHDPDGSRQYAAKLAWMKANPDRVKLHDRNVRLRKKYGITDDEYQEMHASQDGKCALCGDRTELFVDHDHSTGAVRALLCAPCNKGLGFFRDNPSRLRKAIKYLGKY